MIQLKQHTDSESLLSVLKSGRTVAVTAPLVTDNEVLIGYSLSPDEASCSIVPLDKFEALSSSIYLRVNSKRIFHGLKRVWESLDGQGLRSDTDTDKRIDINKIDDTKLLAYLLDPDSGREGEFGEYRIQEGLTLANLSARYLGDEYPNRNTDIYEKGPREALAEILTLDARLIFLLAVDLPGHMNEELRNLYRRLELPLMVVLDNMRRVGVGVDGVACVRELERIENGAAALAQEITGGQEIDLRSDREVFRFLVGLGVPFLDQRAYQWQRVTTRTLEETAAHYPFVQGILDYRRMMQDLSFLRQAAGQDRVHPVWGQTRSATSRIYARGPAVQNVSRGLRHVFVPAAGHVLVKADYSQAQMRILAHLSRDEELMRVFNDPRGDVHTETSQLLGLNDRGVAKEINFAICFGMSPLALSRKINALRQEQGSTEFIDAMTASDYIGGFYSRYPRIKLFFDLEWGRLKNQPLESRGVPSPLGRFRRFNRRATERVQRQFRVTWPQQIEADLIKSAMVRLDTVFRRRNMAARIVMMIHDSLWVEASKDEEGEVRHLMRRMMATAAKLSVPLQVDFD